MGDSSHRLLVCRLCHLLSSSHDDADHDFDTLWVDEDSIVGRAALHAAPVSTIPDPLPREFTAAHITNAHANGKLAADQELRGQVQRLTTELAQQTHLGEQLSEALDQMREQVQQLSAALADAWKTLDAAARHFHIQDGEKSVLTHAAARARKAMK